MAVLGGAIALFAYTRFVDRPAVNQTGERTGLSDKNAEALLTSLSMQEGQIDFTMQPK